MSVLPGVRLFEHVGRSRIALAALDAACWVVAVLTATYLRFEFHFESTSAAHLVMLLATVAAVHTIVGSWVGLYTGRWRPGSFDEAHALGVAAGLTALATLVLDVACGHPVPYGAALGAGPLAFLGCASHRWWSRHRREHRPGLSPAAAAATRVVVFGAGDGGASAVAAMLRDPDGVYLPVSLLDDNPRKRGLRLHGVVVAGGRDALEAAAQRYQAGTLLVAIPSADAALIRGMADRARTLGMTVKVLPPVRELFDGVVHITDIRTPSYADLLGRREVELDLESIAGYLGDRRVLVTGAGGSIGSELCRQLQRFSPASLVMLDRDESALHGVQLSIKGHALLDDPCLVVADIRDSARLADVFAEHRPHVVFHAAALKHLPLLEMHPSEAVKSNVWGTWNVLAAADAVGAEKFVNISTDKAADPVSVLGSSKRVAERITAWFDAHSSTDCISVRFGNVLGSRGSVLTSFQAQIAAGRPVTVTHPDVTRYFMTVEEAVRLVIQAGAVGRGGEALVLDMGQPVRIADVARRLIRDAGSGVQITYTGLRSGEKLHEALLAESEPDLRPLHPLISHVRVPHLRPVDVRTLPVTGPRELVAAALNLTAYAPVTIEPRTAAVSGERRHIRRNGEVVPHRRASDPLVAP